ncbi:Hypothetical predicted protein [Mytilus galloprovincialis]|uniref:Uncharacterized protein n=1 Tax=Mytilus galloprovincialis TaxID=29158 RepID=A0A8B6BZ90_MYTGA|nr:Hypothetical predicted protein [Mytilus galloprovincialis]
MPAMVKSTDSQECRFCFLHHCLNILPTLECRSPTETYQILMSGKSSTDKEILFDDIEFHSETFQRPYQYLKRQDTHTAFDDVNPSVSEDDHLTCLNVLLRHCGLNDPSWSEIYHFVSFLDKQLQDFEKSNFCSDAARESLPGFAEFVLRFLIQMSKAS